MECHLKSTQQPAETWRKVCPKKPLLQILGLEKPVWDETLDKWNVRLGDLMTEDMNYATKYGELFANLKAVPLRRQYHRCYNGRAVAPGAQL